MWVQALGETGIAFIPYYAVDRIWQGHGVGQALFAFVRRLLAEQGQIQAIIWEIEVPEGDNDDPTRRRLRFYERNGGQIVPLAKGFRAPDMTDCRQSLPLWLMVAPVGDYPLVNDADHALQWVDALLTYDLDYRRYPDHRAQILAELRASLPLVATAAYNEV